jgi:hypothetical protein
MVQPTKCIGELRGKSKVYGRPCSFNSSLFGKIEAIDGKGK